MLVSTVLKLGVGLVGVVVALVLFISGLKKKDNRKLRRAGLVFMVVWVMVIVLGVIEFLFLTNE